MGLDVLIHGLGVEGRAATARLIADGAKVATHDAGGAVAEGARALGEPEARALLGPGFLYLRSPGVPPADGLYRAAIASGATVTTPTGWWLGTLAPPGVITITGTKGKSTTSALTAMVLRAGGVPSAAYGNIGEPPFAPALPSEDAPIVELSSYMAADLIAPADGRRWRHVVTNLYKEHTTWHGGEAPYRAAKLSPYRWSPPCPGLAPAELIAAEALPLGVDELGAGLRLDDSVLTIDGEAVDLGAINDAFRSPGTRLAARAAASIAWPVLGEQTGEALAAAAAAWTGLPSRQAAVPSSDGRVWIDDALATVPEATAQALDRFGDREVRLILGGLDRGQDMTALLARIAAMPTVRAFGFGQVAEKLRAGGVPLFDTMEDAVAAAADACPENGVVLFSPAAPSGPPHRDYRERAAIFAKAAGG